jgi:hypothetical protein
LGGGDGNQELFLGKEAIAVHTFRQSGNAVRHGGWEGLKDGVLGCWIHRLGVEETKGGGRAVEIDGILEGCTQTPKAIQGGGVRGLVRGAARAVEVGDGGRGVAWPGAIKKIPGGLVAEVVIN